MRALTKQLTPFWATVLMVSITVALAVILYYMVMGSW